MTTSHGVFKHDNGTAGTRLRQGKLKDNPAAGGPPRVWDLTTTGPYEVICPVCDDPSLDFSEVSPEIQAIRGSHADAEDARAALREHIGLQP